MFPFQSMVTIVTLYISVAMGADPTLGAIRWDAWTGSTNSIGVQVEKTLSPSSYHYRVPFFGVETGENSVTIDGTTQGIMDQEIDFATYAGLDYWAFLWYPATSGLDESLKLYKSSAKKAMLDYCLVIEHERFVNQISIQQILDEFKDASYVRVIHGRPLLYIMGYSSLQTKDIDTLIVRSQRQGTGNPYIVQLRVDGSLNVLETYHMDAFSMYAVSWMGNGVAYQELISRAYGYRKESMELDWNKQFEKVGSPYYCWMGQTHAPPESCELGA